MKPGGSGRDHRPLCAALATWTTPSALSGPTGRPFCKRPTLTRASRRPTKGGRQAPAPCGLVGNGLLVRRVLGGLPPRPGFPRLTRVEQGGFWMNEPSQIRREEIPLGARAAGTDVPAIRTGLLLDSATVTGLGEARAPGVDQNNGPASTRSQARHPQDIHPRRTQLPRFLTKAPGFDLEAGKDGSHSRRPARVDGRGRAAPAA